VLRVRRRHHPQHGLRRALAGFAAGVLLLAATPPPAPAFGPAALEKMTGATLRLAPAALRSALGAYRGLVDRGVHDTIDKQGRQPSAVLVAALQAELQEIPSLPKRQSPFEEVAYRFGRVAALNYLLNDPLREADDERLAAVRGDYRGYLDRKLPLMPLVFDGYDNPPLSGDADAYFSLDARARRAERYREALLFCYYPGGKAVSSETFDDRSNAFGVAQAAASHAVSDAAKSWFHLWRAMDGDLSATPYYRPPKKSGDEGAPPAPPAGGHRP